MSRAVEQFKSELEELSQEDKAELAHFLLESLAPADPNRAYSEDELSRRVQEIREGRAEGRLAEKVFADLRQRHP